MSLYVPSDINSCMKFHKITKRTTPEMFLLYKLAISLLTTFKNQNPNEEWIQLNFQQMSRQTNFMPNRNIKSTKLGLSVLEYRFNNLTSKIPLHVLHKVTYSKSRRIT